MTTAIGLFGFDLEIDGGPAEFIFIPSYLERRSSSAGRATHS